VQPAVTLTKRDVGKLAKLVDGLSTFVMKLGEHDVATVAPAKRRVRKKKAATEPTGP
jgi:hypothetical protein